MSDSVHLGLRISRALNEALEEVAADARSSKSEVARHFLREEVLDSETEIPEHFKIQLEREKLKAKNSHTWQKVYFRSNVLDKFKSAFEQGDLDGELGDAAVEHIRQMYVEDAENLFQDEENRERAIQFVNEKAKKVKEATELSEFHPLEEDFTNHQGVQEGREREKESADPALRDAREMLSAGRSKDFTAKRLADHYDLTLSKARTMVRNVADTLNSEGGASADD